MLVTRSSSGLAPQRHGAAPADAPGGQDYVPHEDGLGDGPGEGVDDFAAARGLLLGAALGAVCLGVLAVALWWML